MLIEAGQAAVEAAKQGGQGTATIIGLVILIVSNVGIWLDKFVQMSRNKAARQEAEAREAEAKAAAAAGKPGTNGHAQYILPHSLTLERHEGEIKALRDSSSKLERENREDHGKIFTKLDELKTIVLTGEAPPGGPN